MEFTAKVRREDGIWYGQVYQHKGKRRFVPIGKLLSSPQLSTVMRLIEDTIITEEK